MKPLIVKPYTTLLVLAALLSACSGPAENSGSPNTNAPTAQANSNSSTQPNVAQGNASTAAPTPPTPTVQQIPQPPPPVEKPIAGRNANAANSSAAAGARAPKLVVPDKKIDYGKQPQGKTLVRAIVIKNGGLADLNIESVAPS